MAGAMDRAVKEADRLYLQSPRHPVWLAIAAMLVVVGFGWFLTMLSSIADKCTSLPDCASRLSPGWLPIGSGRIDLSDHQWASTRSALIPISAAVGAMALGSRLVRVYIVEHQPSSATADLEGTKQRFSAAAPQPLVWYYAACGVIFSVVLSGADALLLTGIVVAVYVMNSRGFLRFVAPGAKSTTSPRIGDISLCKAIGWHGSWLGTAPIGPTLTWTFLLGWVAAAGIANPVRRPLDISTLSGGILSQLKDLLPGQYRWTLLLNILLLKLVSYSMDLHMSRSSKATAGTCPTVKPVSQCPVLPGHNHVPPSSVGSHSGTLAHARLESGLSAPQPHSKSNHASLRGAATHTVGASLAPTASSAIAIAGFDTTLNQQQHDDEEASLGMRQRQLEHSNMTITVRASSPAAIDATTAIIAAPAGLSPKSSLASSETTTSSLSSSTSSSSSASTSSTSSTSSSSAQASRLASTPASTAARIHSRELPIVLRLCRSTGLANLGLCGIDHWDAAAVEDERTDGLDIRTATNRAPDEQTILHLFAYSLYPPLMVAGPIVSFNAFISQLSHQIKRNVAPTRTVMYTLRWAGALVLLEAWLHAFPIYAVNASHVSVCHGHPEGVPIPADLVGYYDNEPHIKTDTGQEACEDQMLLRWLGLQEGMAIWETSVLLLWLKFVVLWRFFRGLALWDGIVCEENQAQCVWMTSSIAGFWKGWHRSFNRWIVRYMYIPMGGARSSSAVQAGSGLVVFVFVALWHEFSVQLLVWGFVFGLLSAPEIITTRLLHSSSSPWAKGVRQHWLYSLLTSCQGVLAVYILIFGNLLGFSSGMGGAASYFARFASWRGLLAWSVYTVWHVAVVQTTSAVRAARGYDVAKPSYSTK